MEKKCVCLILNYNDYETTEKLLNSIKSFSCIEGICIVDNCSTDNSYAVLKKYASEKIKVIKTDKHGGYGYGNNYGIRYIAENFSSDYILISNPDVQYKEYFLQTLIKRIQEEDKTTAAISGKPLTEEGEAKEPPGWNLLPLGKRLLSVNYILGKIVNNRITLGVCDCLQGSLLLVDKNIMLGCGMFDEDFFLYCEEDVLGCKFKKAGLHSIVVEDSYIHAHSVSIKKNITSTLQRQNLLMKSYKIFLKKYYGVSGIKYLLILPYLQVTIMTNTIIIEVKKKLNTDDKGKS